MSSTLNAQDRVRRRVAAATIVGKTVEWYDFFIYANAVALVFNANSLTLVEAAQGSSLRSRRSVCRFFSGPWAHSWRAIMAIDMGGGRFL